MTNRGDGEKTLASRIVYRGKTLRLRVDEVELPNGASTVREVVDHEGAVAVVALNEAEQVLLIRQHRYAAGRHLWEIPAGTLGGGEDPVACASRELVEETSYKAKRIRKLFEAYSSPGYSSEKMRVFLAEDLEYVGSSPEGDEFITAKFFPLEEAWRMLLNNDIQDMKTISGLLWIRAGRMK